MYLLMSAFHSSPWLKLIASRRNGARRHARPAFGNPHQPELTAAMAFDRFFSWQADAPNGIGRDFARKALETACEHCGDASVDDAYRDF